MRPQALAGRRLRRSGTGFLLRIKVKGLGKRLAMG